MANLATLPESSLEEDMSASVASSSESSDLRNEKVLLQVQERLKKQLLDKKHEIEDRIYEQKRYLLRATKDREEAGVQLYDLQCNLASLHASLTKTTVALDTASQGHAKVNMFSFFIFLSFYLFIFFFLLVINFILMSYFVLYIAFLIL